MAVFQARTHGRCQMQAASRTLSLTPDHVARVHRVVADTGPAAGVEQQTDGDYADWVARIAGSHPGPDMPTQLFAYGSLIWKPEIEHRGEQMGVARGWHRAFCLRQHRFRGTVDQPGLMMALDRGGQCRGVLCELPKEDLERQLDQLFRREFTVKPINNVPRWIMVQTDSGPVTALGFVMNRASPYCRPAASTTAASGAFNVWSRNRSTGGRREPEDRSRRGS